MGILSGDQKQQPMHYGEVFSAWTFLQSANGMISGYQTFQNHAGDGDLDKLLQNCIDQLRTEIQEVETLLKENGVALPSAPPERPKAQVESIPAGARFTDPEIAAAVSRDLAQGLTACSMAMGQCTREDIAMMYGQFHVQKAQLAASTLRLNKEKGWLIVPPLHQGTPEPAYS
ncbi:DUF3231 family protein [Halalkalibacter urbisdiaboli]|uniref:DUF3231 family protein n=1 Tax=Halalkalibacter urbisdiaboli TaxID=1960589 RepID=UPI000B4475C6|nr:DUF3231 family protein [Halalkalibacter urbisdiaboli]